MHSGCILSNEGIAGEYKAYLTRPFSSNSQSTVKVFLEAVLRDIQNGVITHGFSQGSPEESNHGAFPQGLLGKVSKHKGMLACSL